MASMESGEPGGAVFDNIFTDRPLPKENILDEAVDDMGVCSVHICYHKNDKNFVQSLWKALNIDNRDIWIDWDDVPNSPEWTDEVNKGIENTDAFIFVLSPDCNRSQSHRSFLAHAVANGKRIIPVVCREVDYRHVSKDIAFLNWIIFRQDQADFQAAMILLLKTLDNDQRHAQYHTKILRRAIEWERHDFGKSLLLKKKDLTRAQHWLSASTLGKEPKPTTLHLSFINASTSLESNMKRRKLISLFFVFIVVIGVAWPSWGVFFFSLIFSHFFVYFSSSA